MREGEWAVPDEVADTALTQRDWHLQFTTKHGRAACQKASRYMKRARAEVANIRFKNLIGGGVHSRTSEQQAIEMEVAAHVLNRMLELGRPPPVRIA